MARVNRITDAWMDREQTPGYHWCKSVRGLGVYVSRNRRNKSFICQKGNSRVTIGKFGQMSLRQARDFVENAQFSIAGGTIESAFELWAKDNEQEGGSPLTVANRELQLKKWLGDDWTMQLGKVNHAWLKSLQQKVSEHSLWAANDVIRHLKTIYVNAVGDDRAFSKIKRRNTQVTGKRKKFPKEDPRGWWATVQNAENPLITTYYLWVVLTGLRESEILGARWENLKNGWLYVENAKRDARRTDKRFNRPIPKQLLDSLPGRESEWVFSSPNSRSGHIEEPHNYAGVKGSTLLCGEHAVRHWWRAQAESVAPYPAVKSLMNHSEKRGTTDIYGVNDLASEELIKHSQKIADHIAGLIGLKL